MGYTLQLKDGNSPEIPDGALEKFVVVPVAQLDLLARQVKELRDFYIDHTPTLAGGKVRVGLSLPFTVTLPETTAAVTTSENVGQVMAALGTMLQNGISTWLEGTGGLRFTADILEEGVIASLNAEPLDPPGQPDTPDVDANVDLAGQSDTPTPDGQPDTPDVDDGAVAED